MSMLLLYLLQVDETALMMERCQGLGFVRVNIRVQKSSSCLIRLDRSLDG